MLHDARQNEAWKFPKEFRDFPARKKWTHAPGEATVRVLRERTPVWILFQWKGWAPQFCRLQPCRAPKQSLPGTNYAVGATSASAGRDAGCEAFWRRLRMKARRRRRETRRSIFDQNAAK